jgi:hypothetical protein
MFAVHNRSDQTIYEAEADFFIQPDGSVQLVVPKDSLHPLSYERRAVDVLVMDCRDEHQRPVFVVSIHRMAPNESREISLKQLEAGSFSVTAKTGFYTTEPQPAMENQSGFGRPFRSSVGGRCKPAVPPLIKPPYLP